MSNKTLFNTIKAYTKDRIAPNVTKNNSASFAYQQNIRSMQPQQQETWTTGRALASIASLSETDPAKAQKKIRAFQYLQTKPGTAYYNPYTQPTNSAVANLQGYGFDTNNLTKEWFDANEGWIASNLLYNGTTNTPSKPGAKATEAQKVAYELYQYQKSEADTQKAEQQWEALKKDITYWTQRADRNYSDDEIISKINWSKYDMLVKMDKDKVYSPTELNRPIDYSQDALRGVIWAARNNGGTGDIYTDMANSYLGVGNVWHEDPAISAKLNKNNKLTYSAYSVGSTMDEECAYFDVPGFDRKTLDKIRASLAPDDTVGWKMYSNAEDAFDKTEALKKSKEKMDEEIETLLKWYDDPDDIINAIKANSDYNGLFKLDETLRSTNLIPTTSAIDYKWEDVEQDIRNRCAEKGKDLLSVAASDVMTDIAGNTVGVEPGAIKPPVVEAAEPETKPGAYGHLYIPNIEDMLTDDKLSLMEEEEWKSFTRIASTIFEKGTPEEKNAFISGCGVTRDSSVLTLTGYNVSEQDALKSVKNDLRDKAVGSYLPALRVIDDFEDCKSDLEKYQNELHKVNLEVTSLEARQRATGDLNEWDAAWVDDLVQSDGWEEAKQDILSDDPNKQYKGYNYVYTYKSGAGNRMFGNGDNLLNVSTDVDEVLEKVPELKRITDAAVNGGYGNTSSVLDKLTAAEEEHLYDLYDTQELLEERISDLEQTIEDGQADYDEAIRTRDSVRNDYKAAKELYGDSVSDRLLSGLENWNTAAKTWTAYPFDSYTFYDRAVQQGASTEALSSYAAGQVIGHKKMLTELQELLDNYQGLGIEASEEDVRNVQQKIDVLQKEYNEAARFLLTTVDDFSEQAEAGKKLSTDTMSDFTKSAVNALLTGEVKWSDSGFIESFSDAIESAGPAFQRIKACVASMTPTEKDLYFYLLKESGENAANDYLKDIMNPVNGMLPHRVEAEKSANTIEQMAKGSGYTFGNWLLSFGENALGNFQSWAKMKEYDIRGVRNYDPKGAGFSIANEVEAIRAGVEKYIDKNTGKNAEALKFFVNAITSAGDSTLNMLITGGALNLLGEAVPAVEKLYNFIQKAESGAFGKVVEFGAKALEDWAHAIPMALAAADNAYRQAITDGADPTQAKKMYAATFWAESISEAITVGNIQDMWARGASEEVEGFFITLFRNGFEEAVGEGFNQWWEDSAEQVIMGELSTYNQMVESLVAANIPRSKAEEIANQQMVKNIAIAAASGFVSSMGSSTGAFLGGSFRDASVNDFVRRVNESDYAKLSKAELNKSGKNSPAFIESVLRTRAGVDADTNYAASIGVKNTLNDFDTPRAAADAFVQNLNKGSGLNALRTMKTLIAVAGNKSANVKTAVTIASLTEGAANNALQRICDTVKKGGEITSFDVDDLLASAHTDITGEKSFDISTSFAKSVANHRIATETVRNAATQADTLDAAKKAVESAKVNVATREEEKKKADAKVESATGNMASAVAQQVLTPTKEGNGPVQQTTNELAGAVANQQQKGENLETAQQQEKQAEEELANTQDNIMAEARTQANESVAQQVAEKNAQEAQKAEEDFNLAVQTYHPKVAFPHAVTVNKIDGTGSVQLTGIFGIENGVTIYSTPIGYISDSELDAWSDADLPVFDEALSHWHNGDTPVKPAAWMSHSLKAEVLETGEVVDLIGFAGEDNLGDPVVVDANGTEYSSDEIQMRPDEFTGQNGNQALFEMFNKANDGTLPTLDIGNNEEDIDPDFTIEGAEVLDEEDTGTEEEQTPGPTLEEVIENENEVAQTEQAKPEYGTMADTGKRYLKVPNGTDITYDYSGTPWKVLGFTVGSLTKKPRIMFVDQNGIEHSRTISTLTGSGEKLFTDNPELAEWMANVVIPEIESGAFEANAGHTVSEADLDNLKSLFDQNAIAAIANQNSTSEGKTNPVTGEALKNWQDPKYHGKVQSTTKKTNPKTKSFKKWFKSDEIPDNAKPYLVNDDGSPKVYFRGYGNFGHTLYNVMQSKPFITTDGKKVSINFFFSVKETAAKYAGTTKISHLRYIKNWETAKAAMQDIGYDLVEAPNPNNGAKMGYQVVKGTGVPVDYGELGSTWFAENELNKFRMTYGGGLHSKGIHAVYLTTENPLVISGIHTNYSQVYADVTAPDGANEAGTHRTRWWAKWAFEHGYDAVIFDEVQDNPAGGGGAYGVEIVVSQPNQVKSVYNSGKFSTTDDDIMANKVDTSKQLTDMVNKLNNISLEDMTPQERQALRDEILSIPEVSALIKQQTQQKATLPYILQNAIRSFDGNEEALRQAGVPEATIKILMDGGSYIKAIESLFTEDEVKEQHRIRDKMAKERGSAVFDEDGDVEYNGDVEQGKRLDVIVGLPASGKSTLADALSAEHKSRMLDSDDAKKFHRNYNKGANSSPLHNESRFITDQAMHMMMDNGDNVVLPVVGHSYNSVMRQIKAFKDAGYEVHLHNVQLPWSKAVGRTLNRMMETNRLLDVAYITGTDSTGLSPQKINDTFDRIVKEGQVDGYAVWNNDVQRGQQPVALEYSDESEVGIKSGAFGGKNGGTIQVDSGRGTDNIEGGMGKVQEGNADVSALSVDTKSETPTKKQAKKVKKKLKSPQQIAKTLIKGLGFGEYMGSNNFGNLPKSVRAYWSKHGELVAVKDRYIGDYTKTIHEVGHGIAQKLGLTGTSQMVANLLAEEPSFASSYSADELQGEAFAEFMWRYMESDERARAFAGDDFVDMFERQLNKDPKMAKEVAAARADLQQYINASLDERTQAVIRYEHEKDKIPFAQQLKDFISRNVDRTAIADDVDAFVEENSGVRGKLRLQSLFANHAQKRALVNLTESLTDADGTIIGDGLGLRLSNVGFKGTESNVHLLERYALLLHSIDREKQNKPVFWGMDADERQAEIDRIEHEHPEIKAAEKAWQDFRTDFLQAWMVDTGYWTQDFLDTLNKIYPHYVPTFRVRGNKSDGQAYGFGKSKKKYTLKAAVGGSEDIYSPMYSFIGMVDQITNMVATNQIAQKFDEYYQENGGMGIFGRQIPGEEAAALDPSGDLKTQLTDILEGSIPEDLMQQVLEVAKHHLPAKASEGRNLLTVHREDGTQVQYEIDNPQLYKLLTGAEGSTGIRLMQPIGKFTRMMSMLTTGSNPLFAARNAVRDYQNSVNYGSWASNYGTGLPKWLMSLAEVATNSDAYKEYQALGGGGWTYIDQNNSKNMKQITTEMFGDDKSSLGKTAKWLGKKVWNTVTMARLNEIIEQASRFAEYKYGKNDKSTAEGRMEAFQKAQDVTVDFSRTGNDETAYVMKKLIPFFNASLQGAYRTGRTLTEAERDRLGTRVTKTIVNQALASALAVGLVLRSGDDDDKEEFMMLSDGVKANHLILPNPLKGMEGQPPYIRIPLAQDPLSYAVHSLVTNAMANGSTDEMAISLAATADVILDNLNPLGGTILQPFLDVSHNKTWYGSNIVRTSQVDWADKSSQYNEDTPEFFKTLGRWLNTSPEVLEYLASQYTGFIGAMAIPALSIEKDGSIGGFDSLMNTVVKKWTSDPMSSNDVSREFREKKKILSTVVDIAKAGRTENMLLRSLTQEEIDAAYEEASAMLASGGIVYEANKLINDTYKAIDDINANTSLSDAEKYDQTRALKLDMLKRVEAANEEMQAYYKKYIQGETLTDRVFGAIQKGFTPGGTVHIKTPDEKMPETFLKDVGDENSVYMQRAMSVYNGPEGTDLGGGKTAALPHPSQTFKLTLTNGEKKEYTISEEAWPMYTEIYKAEYERYILTSERGLKWETLSNEDRYDLLQAAAASANKKMKEAYARDNGIPIKK